MLMGTEADFEKGNLKGVTDVKYAGCKEACLGGP
jgi:hypothetical protein